MDIDNPAVLAEVTALFQAYEVALTTNDVATLDAMFWQHASVVRYGATENLHGHAEIAAFRASRPSVGLQRDLVRTVITTFGENFATASTTFTRNGRIGRQQQSWVRLAEGWRVVAAHVSLLPEGVAG